MNKESQKAYSRELKEEHFKQVEIAIKNGKTDNALTYPELQEELVKKFKGKTIEAPLEVIFTSFYFITSQETKEDTIDSIILAGIEIEKRKKRKEKEDTTTEKHESFS